MKTVVKQEVYYSDGSMQVLEPKPRKEGMFAFMLHDYQSSDFFRPFDAKGKWGYKVPRMLLADKDKLQNDDGFPQMVPGNPRIGVKLEEHLQWFMVKQLVLSKYGIHLIHGDRTIKYEFYRKLNKAQQDYIKEAWRQLTRDDTAFTNHSGTNAKKDPTGKDFIRDTDGGRGLPKLWENSCGGSTHLVNQAEIPSDAEWIEIKTLKVDRYGFWKNYNFIDNREFFVFATNITPYLVGTRNTLTEKGPWKVDPMHMLGGAHVVIPLMSNSGTIKFRRSRLEIMTNVVEFRSPYVQ